MGYWLRKGHLEQGIFLLQSIKGTDQVAMKMRQETVRYLSAFGEFANDLKGGDAGRT